MYKIFFACLPLLFACNMATNNGTAEKERKTDTIVTSHQEATTTNKVNPRLQAIKWSGMKEMTDESFKSQVLASSSLTLVDFNAEWCGPCKKLKPILDQLVKEYDGKLNFASVDVDECPEAARYYNVSSIPMLAFYENAKQGNTAIGLQPYKQLKKMIDNELNAK
jgi:thioredoxin 1